MATATSSDTQAAITEITPEDLQDPHLFRLNNLLQFLASQIAYLQGGSGPIKLLATVTGPGFFDQDDTVPSDPDQLLTLGAAQELFGASNQISANELTTNPIPPIQPITPATPLLLEQEATAVHGTTTAIPVTYAPSVGALLLVTVSQDSTGGGQITWNSLFVNAPVNIGRLPNTINLFLFAGREDPVDSVVKWFLISVPPVGQNE